ncbi:endonuclease/exonuclease/phosphatase family protein [Oceanicaulis sp. LC35]|uniref:endonuclease/exonuclease/phosphatase family protein n=1 Tax=Oceanicaulis sp. LC35 TaxID=3349635 RepID=UPI003F84C9DB
MIPTPNRLPAVYQILSWLACIGACLGLALVIGLSLTGRVYPKADVFNMLWPLPVLAGVTVFTTLWVFRAKGLFLVRGIGMAASATLVFLALPYAQLIARPDALPPRSETGEALRLVTFNLWNLNRDHDAAIAFLRNGDFDVAFLQEIGGSLREIPQSLEAEFPHQIRCPWGATLISRLPVIEQGCDAYRTVPIAYMQIEFQGAPLRLTSTHFARPTRPDLYAYHRERLAGLIADQTHQSQILAGDFNTAEHGFQMRLLAQSLDPLQRITHGLRTWPSERALPIPVIGIDHIWISEDLCASRTGVAPDAGSDHRPVMTLVERCGA